MVVVSHSTLLRLCLSPSLHCSSKLIFKNPDKEDFGTFSVSVSNTDGVSSSYKIRAEGKIFSSLCSCGSGASPPSQALALIKCTDNQRRSLQLST